MTMYQTVFANIRPVTPNNSNDLTNTGILYVGGAGNISLDLADGVNVTINGVAAGTILPVRVKRVRATGTTATNIAVMY